MTAQTAQAATTPPRFLVRTFWILLDPMRPGLRAA